MIFMITLPPLWRRWMPCWHFLFVLQSTKVNILRWLLQIWGSPFILKWIIFYVWLFTFFIEGTFVFVTAYDFFFFFQRGTWKTYHIYGRENKECKVEKYMEILSDFLYHRCLRFLSIKWDSPVLKESVLLLGFFSSTPCCQM